MSYIVRNCPAKYYEFIDDEQKCFLKDKKCKHIPDCLLKQIAELHNEHIKENKVNEMCMQKFNKPDEIKNCKAILMKMEIKQ